MNDTLKDTYFSFYGSIVVKVEDIQRIVDALSQMDFAFSAEVIKTKKEIQKLDDISFLHTISNTRTSKILAMIIDGIKGEKKVRFAFGRNVPTLIAAGTGLDKEDDDKVAKLFQEEKHNLRTFYWFIPALFFWFLTKWRLLITVPLFLVLLGFSIYKTFSTPDTYYEDKISYIENKDTGETIKHIDRTIYKKPSNVKLVLVSILMILFLILTERIFPLCYFVMGYGIDYYNYIIMLRTIYLGSIVIPIVLKIIGVI